MSAGTSTEKDDAAGVDSTRGADTLDMQWRALDKKKQRAEKVIAAGQAQEFRRQKTRTLAAFNKQAKSTRAHDDVGYGNLEGTDVFDLVDALAGTISELRPAMEKAIRAGFAAGASALDISLDVVMDDPIVKSVIQGVNKKAKSVPATTLKNINRLLANGIKNDIPTAVMAQSIAQMFDHASIVRAQMIAQTAGNAGFEGGQKSAFKAGGANKKQWLTQRDGAVRAHHIYADGETVGTDEPFTGTGEAMQHPGDPAGSAGNVINCRCSMLPIIEKPDDEAQ